MSKRIRTLGLMTLLLGLLLSLTMPGGSSIQAKDLTGAADAQGLRDLGRITAAPVAYSVTSASATVAPPVRGASSRLKIKFQTSEAGQLNPGQEITITLDQLFQVPGDFQLDASRIFISADAVTGGGVAHQVVRVDGVSGYLGGEESDMPEFKLVVPDMDTTGAGAAGDQGIANNAMVAIVFHRRSGIKNPSVGGNYELRIRTDADQDTVVLDGPTGVNIR